jgi:hypothetical protein
MFRERLRDLLTHSQMQRMLSRPPVPVPGPSLIHPVCTRPVLGTHLLILYLAESLTPSPPVRPPRDSYPLERVIGSTLSPDEDVQEAARLASQNVPDSYVVPVVPIIATLGKHEHTANATSQPIHPVSSSPMAQPNPVHPDVESSSHTSRVSPIQRKAEGLSAVGFVNASRENSTPGALSMTQAPLTTGSKSIPSPDRIKSNPSSVPHSAYPLLTSSEGEGLDKLSTRAVGGDTSVTSLSTSVGNGGSEMSSSRKAVADIEHAPLPIFHEEHGRALGTQRGRVTPLPTAGSPTVGVVAAKQENGTRFQRSTSPGITKSSHFSVTRKLTKHARHSLSGGGTEDTSTAGRASTDLPAGAAFPESTYVIEDGVGTPQDFSKDPHLAPLPVSTGHSGIVETATTGSPERKQHRLIKKHSPTADPPPRVSDSSIRPSGTLTGLRADVDTKCAPETGSHTLVNGSVPKPKLMDRIKGEVKILQGTIKGDEGKKMEGRMLKEFGSF